MKQREGRSDNGDDWPGTERQQRLLQTIVRHYAADERVRATLLFGSLARGDWDAYSDLDLDIVLFDGVPIDARAELAALCAALREDLGLEALIMANQEEGDVLLSNLLEFSIRYHLLTDTKPAILASMRRLSGSLTGEAIREAANYDYAAAPPNMAGLVDQCLRYLLQLHHAGRRRRVWMALELLQRLRGLLLELYALSQGAARPVQFFDAQAGPELRTLLAGLVAAADLESIEQAFANALALLENHLGAFSNGQIALTAVQRQILGAIGQLPREVDA